MHANLIYLISFHHNGHHAHDDVIYISASWAIRFGNMERVMPVRVLTSIVICVCVNETTHRKRQRNELQSDDDKLESRNTPFCKMRLLKH